MQATQAFRTMQDMYNYAANQLVVQQFNPQAVKNNLVQMGVPIAEADTVVQNLLAQMQKKQAAHVQTQTPVQAQKPAAATAGGDGKKTMLMGLAMVAIGFAISGVSFAINGETYVVTYGLIVVGAWYFIKGLVKIMAGK